MTQGGQDTITMTLQAPNHNSGKDEYVVDMTGHETQYWQGTESGLLGTFEFQGACTAGDGSCDTDSKSMGAGFCNFSHLGWNTQTPLSPSSLQNQRILNSSKVGREEEGVNLTSHPPVDRKRRKEKLYLQPRTHGGTPLTGYGAEKLN